MVLGSAVAGAPVTAATAAAPLVEDGSSVEGLIIRYAPGVSPVAATELVDQAAASTDTVDPESIEPGRPIGFGLQTVELDGPVSVDEAEQLADALVASPLVEWAGPDIAVQTFGVQVDPPWNLDRIDQRAPGADGLYGYRFTGAGVRVYVVDSGVRADHEQFGARVVAGFSATVPGGDGRTDPNGHGTHVAGTVAGSTYGVAKEATIVPVQVLGADGFGTASAVIAGLDWIVDTHPDGVPGVVNLSFGADLDRTSSASGDAIDAAVRSVIAAGLTVVVAAGNGDRITGAPKDACRFTPARVGEAITVAASSLSGGLDVPASFSNFGPCTDIFAPGVEIVSAGRSSRTASETQRGTSMAAPHVAGAAAQLLQGSPASSPAEVWSALAAQSTVIEIGSRSGDPDLMLFTESQVVADIPIVGTPSVTGVARVGSTLTAQPGVWGPAPVSLSYSWLRDGSPIDAATGASYVPGADDVGRRISVAVTASKTGFNPVTRTSGQTSPVAALRFASAPTPNVSGSAIVGSTLTARPGTWRPAGPTLAYTWLRNGAPIPDATGPVYVVGPADRGARLSVRVTASQPGYVTTSRTSATTGPVVVATRVARDGTWRVGAQVAVDTYITATAAAQCTWERRGPGAPPPSPLLGDDRGSGQRIVTVGAGDAVLRTTGCGRWLRLADIAPSPRPSIPRGGVYSVTHHIVPGTYRASTPGGRSCYWARLSGFGGAASDVIESASTRAARPVVVIDASTVGFEATAGCGSWTRIG